MSTDSPNIPTTQIMDDAAIDAAKDLRAIDPEAVAALRSWWDKHYRAAGHKRLARVLLKEPGEEKA